MQLIQLQTTPVGLQRRRSVLAAAADATCDFQRAAATGKICFIVKCHLSLFYVQSLVGPNADHTKGPGPAAGNLDTDTVTTAFRVSKQQQYCMSYSPALVACITTYPCMIKPTLNS